MRLRSILILLCVLVVVGQARSLKDRVASSSKSLGASKAAAQAQSSPAETIRLHRQIQALTEAAGESARIRRFGTLSFVGSPTRYADKERAEHGESEKLKEIQAQIASSIKSLGRIAAEEVVERSANNQAREGVQPAPAAKPAEAKPAAAATVPPLVKGEGDAEKCDKPDAVAPKLDGKLKKARIAGQEPAPAAKLAAKPKQPEQKKKQSGRFIPTIVSQDEFDAIIGCAILAPSLPRAHSCAAVVLDRRPMANRASLRRPVPRRSSKVGSLVSLAH